MTRRRQDYVCSDEQWHHALSVEADAFAAGRGRWASPFDRYSNHKSRARIRGIEFSLTFGEWWSIWWQSGHWHQRGTRSGNYVMCRVRDQGPYAVGNVFIGSASLNNSKKDPSEAALPVGVWIDRRWKTTRYRAYAQREGRRVCLGSFDTVDEAHASYVKFFSEEAA